MDDMQDIFFEEIQDNFNKKIGCVTLNRPRALNALSYDMFVTFKAKLLAWELDPTIKAVLIVSSSDRAFCAGGDIRSVYANKDKPVDDRWRYFGLEYSVNPIIYHYKKPYIALLNGIVMGGGAGISLHGSHPIATENFSFAMPETKIGFFPDVGISYYLSRLDNNWGVYLGLTGATIQVNDALALGLISYAVDSQQLNDLTSALVSAQFDTSDKQTVTNIISRFQIKAGPSDLPVHTEEVAACFSHDTVEKIIDALQSGSAWAKAVAADLLKRSPTSLKVALKQLRMARNNAFDQVMVTDVCIAKQYMLSSDFCEGIRAVLIDKDQDPIWQPRELSAVTDEHVMSYFR